MTPPNLTTQSPAPPRLPLGFRLAVSFALGVWGAFISYFSLIVAPQHLAKDFTWPWRAARILLERHNPYEVIQATGPYPFNVGLFYPLPAAIVALPFASLSPPLAGASFFFASAALLGFGLTARREDLRKLPLFASAPFCMAAVLGQWAPLMTAAAVLPAVQFLVVAKPNLGLASWIYRPTIRGAIAAAVFALATLLIVPTWPVDWKHALEAAPRYKGPIMRGATGLVLLLGAVRWRRREGRLFLAMSLVPQLSLFYDQLPLWLIPNTVWRSIALSALSWVAWSQWYPSRALTSSVAVAEPWVFWLLYVPALVLVILLPSREEEPSGVETAGAAATAAREPA